MVGVATRSTGTSDLKSVGDRKILNIYFQVVFGAYYRVCLLERPSWTNHLGDNVKKEKFQGCILDMVKECSLVHKPWVVS